MPLRKSRSRRKITKKSRSKRLRRSKSVRRKPKRNSRSKRRVLKRSKSRRKSLRRKSRRKPLRRSKYISRSRIYKYRLVHGGNLTTSNADESFFGKYKGYKLSDGKPLLTKYIWYFTLFQLEISLIKNPSLKKEGQFLINLLDILLEYQKMFENMDPTGIKRCSDYKKEGQLGECKGKIIPVPFSVPIVIKKKAYTKLLGVKSIINKQRIEWGGQKMMSVKDHNAFNQYEKMWELLINGNDSDKIKQAGYKDTQLKTKIDEQMFKFYIFLYKIYTIDDLRSNTLIKYNMTTFIKNLYNLPISAQAGLAIILLELVSVGTKSDGLFRQKTDKKFEGVTDNYVKNLKLLAEDNKANTYINNFTKYERPSKINIGKMYN